MRGPPLALAVPVVAVAVAVAGAVIVAHGRNWETAQIRAELLARVDRGGIGDLGHAQALGRRLVVADERDTEAATALAFASAVLAVDYGFDTAREADVVLERAGYHRAMAATTTSPPLVAAARALIWLGSGHRDAAARLATAAAGINSGTPYPLYALGRIRARGGDTAGAARALKAAIVGTPDFMPARVALAEARLDMGDAQGARTALVAVLATAPDDLRAGLLLDEAEQALGVVGTSTLAAACPAPRGRWPPSAIRAGCALAYASRARREGSRREALARAEEAASVAPLEPRLLARTAQALAQLGAVDRGAAMLERASRLAAPEAASARWAAAAVALGRGRAAVLPDGPPPADPETQLLRARIALAAGGVGALANALDREGDAALARDIDLRLLAGLRGGGALAEIAVEQDDPVRAYVEGLRARLEGNIPAALANLQHALSGHGDACRAAGEYVAMLRVLKRSVDPASWNLLRAENASCVNLR